MRQSVIRKRVRSFEFHVDLFGYVFRKWLLMFYIANPEVSSQRRTWSTQSTLVNKHGF